MAVNTAVYSKVVGTLNATLLSQVSTDPAAVARLKVADTLRLYPVLLLVCWFPATVNR